MQITVEKSAPFTPVNEGTTVATITQAAFVGNQQTVFSGAVSVKSRMAFLLECPLDALEDGRPKVLFYACSVSGHEKSALFKMAKAVLGDDLTDQFDPVKDFLGKSVTVSVTHREWKDGVFANIETIAPLMAGVEVPEPTGELLSYSVDSHDQETFKKLSKLIRNKIAKRVRQTAVESSEEPFDDDVNF